MKTLREYIDLIDEAQQEQADEGIKSALAGAALAGAIAMNSPAHSQEVVSPPTPKAQILYAIKTGQIPRPKDHVSIAELGPGNVVLSVDVDGQRYEIDPMPQAKRMAATADQIRSSMREEDLNEVSIDAIERIDNLYQDA